MAEVGNDGMGAPKKQDGGRPTPALWDRNWKDHNPIRQSGPAMPRRFLNLAGPTSRQSIAIAFSAASAVLSRGPWRATTRMARDRPI
jgi:hypothetical protein